MEPRGLGPSILSLNIDKLNINLYNMMIRAKEEIKNNDKKNHMVFYLGIINEEEKNRKMYYNIFFKYKIISRYSIELALNSIAVLYSNIFFLKKNILMRNIKK